MNVISPDEDTAGPFKFRSAGGTPAADIAVGIRRGSIAVPLADVGGGEGVGTAEGIGQSLEPWAQLTHGGASRAGASEGNCFRAKFGLYLI